MIENIIELRRGRGVAGLVTGLASGALFCVAPVGLVSIVAGPWLVIELCCLVCDLQVRRLSTWSLAVLSCWTVLTGAAAAAPVKPLDQPLPVELSAERLSVADLSRELELQEGVGDPTLISLPSRRPTWRELKAAIASQTRWELMRPTCGFGASLLFGGALMGRPALVSPGP